MMIEIKCKGMRIGGERVNQVNLSEELCLEPSLFLASGGQTTVLVYNDATVQEGSRSLSQTFS